MSAYIQGGGILPLGGSAEGEGTLEKPTIAELEAIMEEDDLELTILPNGEVRTQKRPTVHALEDMVEQAPEDKTMEELAASLKQKFGKVPKWFQRYAAVPIGTRIMANRKKAGLTQVQLGERVGYTQGAVSLIESGERNPPYYVVVRLLECCGARLNVLRAAATLAQAEPVAHVRIDQEPDGTSYDLRWTTPHGADLPPGEYALFTHPPAEPESTTEHGRAPTTYVGVERARGTLERALTLARKQADGSTSAPYMFAWETLHLAVADVLALPIPKKPVDSCFICEGTLTEHEKDCPQRKDVK